MYQPAQQLVDGAEGGLWGYGDARPRLRSAAPGLTPGHGAVGLVLAAVVALILVACTAGEPPLRTITVTGRGQAIGEPDQVVLVFGLWSKDESPAAAMLNAKTKLDALAAALTAMGIAADEMQTVSTTMNTETIMGPDGFPTERLLYAVNEMRSLSLPDAAAVAPALDAIRNIVGAPYLFSQNVNYELSAARRAELTAEAEAGALVDAEANAGRLAVWAGSQPDEPIEIRIVSEAMPATLPWQVQVTVEVTYALQANE